MKELGRAIQFVLAGSLVVSGCGETSVTPLGSPSGPTEELTRYEYFVFLPVGYDPAGVEARPLILFLHASGSGRDTRESVASYGVPKRATDQALVQDSNNAPDFPFIVVAPQTLQTGQGGGWSIEWLNDLLVEIDSLYAIDADRIYVTGLSMGGDATWLLAMTYPNRFAAIAPVAGVGDAGRACIVQHVPTWIFHNDGDPAVPSSEAQEMFDALNACGSQNVLLTMYVSDSHDSWTEAYRNQGLYDWLLTNKRVSE